MAGVSSGDDCWVGFYNPRKEQGCKQAHLFLSRCVLPFSSGSVRIAGFVSSPPPDQGKVEDNRVPGHYGFRFHVPFLSPLLLALSRPSYIALSVSHGSPLSLGGPASLPPSEVAATREARPREEKQQARQCHSKAEQAGSEDRTASLRC